MPKFIFVSKVKQRLVSETWSESSLPVLLDFQNGDYLFPAVLAVI